jgi:lysophospholipid acyltransferase (LPLAT)-like uncharacterized protein
VKKKKRKKKKPLNPTVYRMAGLAGAVCLRRWMATLDYKVAYYDVSVDPALPYCRGHKLYLFWHEYIPFPVYHRSHCNISILLSQHRDAEVLSHTAGLLGFDYVRGSSTRGGANAIRELLQKSKNMHLAITPDGPRGPRRQLAPGSVFLASKLGLPMVLMGFGYDRPWRINSWDRFAIPRPFSRGRAVVSSEVHVPPDLGRSGLEHYRLRIEQLLNRLTSEAEAWAASGTRKACEQRLQSLPVFRHPGEQSHPSDSVLLSTRSIRNRNRPPL